MKTRIDRFLDALYVIGLALAFIGCFWLYQRVHYHNQYDAQVLKLLQQLQPAPAEKK